MDNKTIHVKIPEVPVNFLTTLGDSVSISEFTEEGLQRIGDIWTEELIKKSKAIKKLNLI